MDTNFTIAFFLPFDYQVLHFCCHVQAFTSITLTAVWAVSRVCQTGSRHVHELVCLWR